MSCVLCGDGVLGPEGVEERGVAGVDRDGAVSGRVHMDAAGLGEGGGREVGCKQYSPYSQCAV